MVAVAAPPSVHAPEQTDAAGGATAQPSDLLLAKLLVPRRHLGTVRRSRLLARLQAHHRSPVVLVVAPPGYGKTSLLVQWESDSPGSTAWLTVDDGDNDPVVFLTDLASAIDRIEHVDRGFLEKIASPAVSNRTVVGRLLGVLASHRGPIRLTIDDVHRLVDRQCLDALAEFISYLPENAQVALAGRSLVDLPFSRWRAAGSLFEIGPLELAMDEQEATGLCRELGVVISAEATRNLARQTEGWPALLALAALGADRSPPGDTTIEAGRDRLVVDYLHSELLEGHSPADVEFLTRTSILENLSGAVCDAVTDRRDSAERLVRLARSTLLVDEYGGQYRYHALLRDFLRSELLTREPARVGQLHRRAAEWYRANGDAERAIEHGFASGDLDLAATLVGTTMLGYHWSGRRTTMRGWFERFDDAALSVRPWLAVLAAWEELAAGNVPATLQLAEIVDRVVFEGVPPDGTSSFESARALLRAGVARRGAEDALANALRAVDGEPSGSPWRDFALWQLAIAQLTLGNRDAADAALSESAAAARANGHPAIGHCVLGHRALVALEAGDWAAASAFTQERDRMGMSASVEGYLSSAPGRAADIRLAIHRGEIDRARRDLTGAIGLRPLMTAAYPASVQFLLAFARAHLAIGDTGGARTLLAQAGGVIRLRPGLGVLPADVAALRAKASAAPPARVGASSLTVAELRVLALLPYYLSFKEIGQRLGVKDTTVKTHALSIYGKLGASTRSDAIDLAVEAGLLEPFLRGEGRSAIAEEAAAAGT